MSEIKSEKTKKYYDEVSVGNRTPQRAYFVQNHDKSRLFEALLKATQMRRVVVVCRSKRVADRLLESLKSIDIVALSAHGNHRASEIEEVALAFSAKDADIFITTDKILQKLALSDIDIVLNYDLPLESSEYFKRLILVDEIGESISFVDPQDEVYLGAIEHKMKCEMAEVELEGFEHTKLNIEKKARKKPRHKKVQQRAKKEEKIKSKWVPSK